MDIQPGREPVGDRCLGQRSGDVRVTVLTLAGLALSGLLNGAMAVLAAGMPVSVVTLSLAATSDKIPAGTACPPGHLIFRCGVI